MPDRLPTFLEDIFSVRFFLRFLRPARPAVKALARLKWWCHGARFHAAWREAQLDLEAERELRICARVGSGFIERDELDAQARLGRFRFGDHQRTPLEQDCYTLCRVLDATHRRRQICEDVEVGRRRIGYHVAAMVPYGR